jgi:hypothetical protein
MRRFKIGDKVIARGDWEKYNSWVGYNSSMVKIVYNKEVMTISQIVDYYDIMKVKVYENRWTWASNDLEKYEEPIKLFDMEDLMI